MGETEPGIAAERNTSTRWLRILISYLIAGICLSWMLYHIHPEHLINRIGNMKWPLVVFFILSGPLWIIGFFAFSHSGIDLLRLRREATKAARGGW